MCFYIRDSRIKIATKDIVCYKRLFLFKIKCIIPKYSLYLINDRNTKYVSTSIKVLKPNWL